MKHWTDKDLADALKEMRIIVDTREKVNVHVNDYFTKQKVQWFNRKLDIGDYSAQLGDDTFEKSVVIERKHNLDELCGNLTADRDRFEREFLRAKAYGTKVFLLIEDASWDDVFLGNYRSKLSSKALLASLLSWQTRFNVTVIFTNKGNTGALIHGILYYAVREHLLYG